MTSPRDELLAELLAERFDAPRRRAVQVPADPGPAVYAQRQRALCAALDGRHLTLVDATQRRAA